MTAPPRHLKLRLCQSGAVLARCDDGGCTVDAWGETGCGLLACPACGYGGANLSVQYVAPTAALPVACRCGHAWIAGRAARPAAGAPHRVTL